MLSQNLLNLIDTAMVGRLGDAALAAVGTGAFLNYMAVAFVTGFSAGVQTIASRRLGEGRFTEMAKPLNGALVLVAAVTLPLSVILYIFAPQLFAIVNADPAVVAAGGPYLRWRIVGMVAVGFHFSFRGYWNGIGKPKLYFHTLILMHSCNVFLNWVLIYGNLGAPALGAPGAGLATTISMFIGMVYYFYLGIRHARDNGFLHGIPRRQTLMEIAHLAIPNGIQQLFFAGGFTALFWIFGLVGTETAAAANVLINIMLVAILPGLALGMAAATLVGQALGRGQSQDARNWGWDVVKVAVVLLGVLGLPMWLVPDLLLSVFIKDPDTLELARLPLIIIGLTIFTDGVGLVLQNALLGAGASRRVMVISIVMQWMLFLPAAYLAGPVLGFGLLGIWIVQVVYRVLQALVFYLQWSRGNWSQIRI